ncbi:uncharacterized protein LOC113232288 [Hyposmocoma kahamanoa]|uniref:uncharacterized protein LOC113232288 n=1 Tax=Hyposmocoma kahamanoa TaxID=1477025 RepID=UPI000E6D7F5F|nr:uncharacterized protein LOC113232288 [Hyposmocoma kahamanoa]
MVGRDLSLPSIVKAILGSERSWQAMVSICEDVMSRKETAERSGEIKATGLDEAVTPEQIAAAVAGTGGCTVSDLRAGEPRLSRSDMFSTWVRCPLTAVKRIAVSNWISAKVEDGNDV